MEAVLALPTYLCDSNASCWSGITLRYLLHLMLLYCYWH